MSTATMDTVKVKTTGIKNPIKTYTFEGVKYYPSHVFNASNKEFFGKADTNLMVKIAGTSYYPLKRK